MIHNGIEYGLMQAYAEGFNILRGAASEELPEEQRYQLDLPDIAEVWRRGSVIRLLAARPHGNGFGRRPQAVAATRGSWTDSGEGRWTINAAIEEAVPADVLSAALYARFRSREQESFSDKLLVRHAQQVRRPCRAEGGQMMRPGRASQPLRPRHFRRCGRPDQAPVDACAL